MRWRPGHEVAADQLEGAVEVAHAEDGADEEAAEDEGVEAPEPRVVPAQAIAGDDVGARRVRQERGQLAQVELAVRVGEDSQGTAAAVKPERIAAP